jgi:recyclin-1
MRVISDMAHYGGFVASLRNADLNMYFRALREVSQVYLIAREDAEGIASVVADEGRRWAGVFGSEEVVEFVMRRADWNEVRGVVEGGVYGRGCLIM